VNVKRVERCEIAYLKYSLAGVLVMGYSCRCKETVLSRKNEISRKGRELDGKYSKKEMNVYFILYIATESLVIVHGVLYRYEANVT